MIKFSVNGEERTLDVEPDMPLLWVLRDELGLTGTKFGCGIASCGACTVHINGAAARSCVTPISSMEGQEVTTIEGIATATSKSTEEIPSPLKVQQAWVDHQVPQCGYCQSGQMMNAAAFLSANPAPSDSEIIEAQQGNICRWRTGIPVQMEKGIP